MKFLLVFLPLVALSLGKDLPREVQVCKRTDPSFNECYRKATVAIQPYMAKGISDLNIAPFEPLHIPMLNLEQGTNAVKYKATITDINIYGLSNYKFTSVKADASKPGNLVARVEIPKVDLSGNYNIKGNLLILPIQGNGLMTANITQCVADVTLLADVTKRKGEDYLQAKDVKIKLSFGGAKSHFENLFNGDPVLGMTTNNFLNENAKDLLNEIKPAIEEVTNALIGDVINKIYKAIPLDKLFPK